MDNTRLGPDFFESLEENIPHFLEQVEQLALLSGSGRGHVSRLELMAVLLIKQSKVCNMSGLAKGLSIPMSTATGLVERLEKKGFINRFKSEEDRRAFTLELSNQGEQLVINYFQHLESLITGWKSNLSKEEFEIFTILFRKMFGFKSA